MLVQTLVLLAAPIALAATPRARSGLSKSLAQSKLTNVFATCGVGYSKCENGCMPIGDVCCNDNTDEYCLEGYYCVPNACCPEGEVCDGASDDDADCGVGETECGDMCMPIDGTCCSDGLHYCPDFGTCTSDGYCCDLGDDCDDGNFSSLSSSLDDDFTSTTSRTTTKKTTTTTSFSDETTSSSATRSRTTSTSSTRSSTTSSTTSSTSSSVSNNEASITPAPPTVTTTVSQQAGGIFTADGKIAAGLAVVAALLV